MIGFDLDSFSLNGATKRSRRCMISCGTFTTNQIEPTTIRRPLLLSMLHPETRPCTAMRALAVGFVCWMVGAVSGAQLPAAVDAIHVAAAGGGAGGGGGGAETAGLPIVVVTGATGRTGSLMYAGLRDSGKVVVRAFVHSNVTEARRILNCSSCDESEGVYYGDVTNVTTLLPVMAGASAVACGIGATEAQPETLEEAIEFRGVENQVAALANQTGSLPPSSLKFVHISSMGTYRTCASVVCAAVWWQCLVHCSACGSAAARDSACRRAVHSLQWDSVAPHLLELQSCCQASPDCMFLGQWQPHSVSFAIHVPCPMPTS
jgi:hypothetical protein